MKQTAHRRRDDEVEDLGDLDSPAFEHAATLPALNFAVSPEMLEPALSEVGLAAGESENSGIDGSEGNVN